MILTKKLMILTKKINDINKKRLIKKLIKKV